MTNLFKKSEIYLVFAVGLIISLRMIHVPFSGKLIVLGFALLALLFFIGSQQLYGPGTSPSQKRVIFFSGMAFSISLIGLMIKLMLWKSTSIFSIVPLVILGILEVVIIFDIRKNPESDTSIYATLLSRSFIFSALMILSLVISNKTLIEIYYDDPLRVNYLIKLEDDPNNEELRAAYEEYQRNHKESEH